MGQEAGDLGDVVIETDLATWDPKSIDVVKKHGLSRMRYDSLMRVYKDPDIVERQYLIHIASDISSNASEKAPSPIEELKEAKDIFALINDLYVRAGRHPDSFSYQMLQQLEEHVSLIEREY